MSVFYALWMVCELRNSTTDENFLQLLAFSNEGHVKVAQELAARSGRIIFLLKMYVQLWTLRLGDTWYFLVNCLGCLALAAAFTMLWRSFSDKRNALLVTAFLSLSFQLNFYYTIPHGYGPAEYFGLIAACLAATLHARYVRGGRKMWPAALATGFFFFALLGTEFNFLLGPYLIAVVALFLRPVYGMKASDFVGYVFVLAILFIAYQFYARGIADQQHTTISFHPMNFLTTFSKLEAKSFAPIGLFLGIDLYAPIKQGVPGSPAVLTYRTLLQANRGDVLSGAAIVLTTFGFVFSSIRLSNLTPRQLVYLASCGLGISAVPTLLVASTEKMQEMIVGGFMQGHIVSYTSQVGISVLLWITAASLHRLRRKTVDVLSAIVLGLIVAITFAYNDVNRQNLSANMQRWRAFSTLAEFISRSELHNRPLFLPEFSAPYAVGSVPEKSSLYENYWEVYADRVLGLVVPVVTVPDPNRRDTIYGTYFPTASGEPVVVLLVPNNEKSPPTIIVLARVKIGGMVHDQATQVRLNGMWQCADVCVVTIPSPSMTTGPLSFEPDDKGVSTLLGRLLLSRDNAWGQLRQ